MKRTKIGTSILGILSILSCMFPVYAENNIELRYSLAETEGEIVFHLNSTSITYDDDKLEDSIKYHITTNAGNYYLDNEDAKSVPYFVEANYTSLTDERGGDEEIPVTFNWENAKGTLDLTQTVADNTTYAGQIDTSITKANNAGQYLGKTTVLFNEHAKMISSDKCFTYSYNESGNITIVDYNSSCGTDVVIPTTIDGHTVTRIGYASFKQKGLTSVEIPSSVKVIESYAFYKNPFETITLNEGLETIEGGAFRQLNSESSLTTIEIPGSVKTIGNNAFAQNKNLTTVILNEGLESIGDRAFSECNITNLELPSTVKYISGFQGNVNLTSVTLNEGLETIEERTFMDNSSITEIVIPSTVKTIGDKAFLRNTSLTTVTLNEGLESIGASAFAGTSITEITIPSTVKTIGDNAFQHMNFTNINTNKLTSITLNEGLETIGKLAFASNELTELTLPSTVKTIGDGAFRLNDINKLELNEGLESIGRAAFESNSLTEITIPSTVTYIGAYDFNNEVEDPLVSNGAFRGSITKVINKTGLAFDWAHILKNVDDTTVEPFINGEIDWYNRYGIAENNTRIVSE